MAPVSDWASIWMAKKDLAVHDGHSYDFEAVHYVGTHHNQMISLLQSELPGYTRPNLLKSIEASSWSTTPLQTEGLWRASIAFDIKSGQLKAGATSVKEGGIWTNKYAPSV